MDAGDSTFGGKGGSFPATTGSLIARFAGLDTQGYAECVEELARRYWRPIHAYLRVALRRDAEEAKDLTQAFFLKLIENRETLRCYAPARGGFRTFLKTLLRHFAGTDARNARALKRGGGVRPLALDDDAAPLEQFLADPRASDPERIFDQAWIVEVLKTAVGRLKERLALQNRQAIFRVFEAHDLAEGGAAPSYAEVAERLGLTEGQVRESLVAARRALQSEIRSELARQTPDDVQLEEELRDLFGT